MAPTMDVEEKHARHAIRGELRSRIWRRLAAGPPLPRQWGEDGRTAVKLGGEVVGRALARHDVWKAAHDGGDNLVVAGRHLCDRFAAGESHGSPHAAAIAFVTSRSMT